MTAVTTVITVPAPSPPGSATVEHLPIWVQSARVSKTSRRGVGGSRRDWKNPLVTAQAQTVTLVMITGARDLTRVFTPHCRMAPCRLRNAR